MKKKLLVIAVAVFFAACSGNKSDTPETALDTANRSAMDQNTSVEMNGVGDTIVSSNGDQYVKVDPNQPAVAPVKSSITTKSTTTTHTPIKTIKSTTTTTTTTTPTSSTSGTGTSTTSGTGVASTSGTGTTTSTTTTTPTATETKKGMSGGVKGAIIGGVTGAVAGAIISKNCVGFWNFENFHCFLNNRLILPAMRFACIAPRLQVINTL